jgi:hypothetical protein
LVALIILKKVKVGLKLANGFGGSDILYISSDLVENNILGNVLNPNAVSSRALLYCGKSQQSLSL